MGRGHHLYYSDGLALDMLLPMLLLRLQVFPQESIVRLVNGLLHFWLVQTGPQLPLKESHKPYEAEAKQFFGQPVSECDNQLCTTAVRCSDQ